MSALEQSASFPVGTLYASSIGRQVDFDQPWKWPRIEDYFHQVHSAVQAVYAHEESVDEEILQHRLEALLLMDWYGDSLRTAYERYGFQDQIPLDE